MILQKVIQGRDSLNKLPSLMEKVGMTRPLIVGSPKLMPRLRHIPAVKDAPTFSGYHPNPDLVDAEEGLKSFRSHGCDGLISLGGGSAMDTAKAVKAYLLAENPEDVIQNRLPVGGGIPHIAIPATAGSGAEATSNAVVYRDGVKLSLSGEALLPEGVVLDASLLETLPEYHQKSCAFDALSQGIESWWSKAASSDSRVHAYLAILGVLDNLRPYLAGDPRAAEKMLEASFESGRAIRMTRTTAAHAMSYQITKKLGLAHGHACMVTLPVLWNLMLEKGSEEDRAMLKELAAVMRLGDPMMVSRLLWGMMYDLEMGPPPMPSRETLDALADSVNPERLGNHPMALSRQDLRQVYFDAFLPMEGNVKQACLDIWRYYGGGDNHGSDL